jgi:hypothetical protein
MLCSRCISTSLLTHAFRHPSAYKCPVTSCAKSFTVRSNAKRHIRTHGIHLPFPQASEGTSSAGGDPSLASTDKDFQRALRIRWVGQNRDEHPEDHTLNLQGSACIKNMRHDGNVDDDEFQTSRLEDVCNRGDHFEGPFGSPGQSGGSLHSDPRPRFVP